MTNPDPSQAIPAPDSDLSLALRIAQGDRIAFELLMRRNNRRLFRVARSVLGDRDEAEDALQEAYLQIYRNISQFRSQAALSTWLTRLVLNECFGRLRRTARRENIIPMLRAHNDAELNAMPEDDSALPDNILARSQIRAVIERKLDELPEVLRTVFVLRSIEELGVEETAQCLGIPQATVRSRHHRARHLMREALAREVDHAERDVYDFGGEHCNCVVARVLSRI
jgi:RNA polymerase sigma factor (sigma-70 family)